MNEEEEKKVRDAIALKASEKLQDEARIKAEDEAHKKEHEKNLAAGLQASDNPIEEAKEILKKIEEQNKVLAENIKRAEKAGAELMIAGRAPAGVEKTQEEEKEASARSLIAGTGLEAQAGFKPEGK